jgi:hypothetical protein
MINKIKMGSGSMTNLTLICYDHNPIFIQSLRNVHLCPFHVRQLTKTLQEASNTAYVSIGFGETEQQWSYMYIV